VLLYHRALVQPALKMLRFCKFTYKKPLTYLKMLALLSLQSAYICILTPYFMIRHLRRRKWSGAWRLPG
jgi:hypothetical protein